MARADRPRDTIARNKRHIEAGVVESLSLSLAINDQGLPIPVTAGDGVTIDSRGDETLLAIKRAIRSHELPVEEGDRLDVELEFTGVRYRSADFSDAIEGYLAGSWQELRSQGVAQDCIKNKYIILKRICYYRKGISEDDRAPSRGDVVAGRGGSAVGMVESSENQGRKSGIPVAAGGLPLKVGHLFGLIPTQLDPAIDLLSEMNIAFREEMAARLTPIVNAHLAAASPGDLEAKKELANGLMKGLTRLGMALQCPTTGKPSSLHAAGDAKNPRGRFQITPKGTNKPTLSRANPADLLPVAVIDDQPRREGLAEWRDRVGRKEDRAK